jgi:IS4 transposase
MEGIYKGCGASYKNRKNKTKSAIKLQVVFDYLNQMFDRLDLTEGIRADQGYKNHLEDIRINDLLIADLGYFVPGCFRKISELGAYFISRYKADTNIYDAETDTKLDLLELLEHQSFLARDVLLGKEVKLPVRIICHKLTDEQSTVRRRKANLLAKGHGYKSSQRNQKLLRWSIFITNIPEKKVSAQHICMIYRSRWQIELLFKLHKSHMKIEVIKGKKNIHRVLCELYAKLCAVLMFQGISSCVELKKGTEFSPTKALLELQKRGRELFLVLNKKMGILRDFLKKLVFDWSKFCLKDRYRKTRVSSLNMLKSIDVNP